VRREAAYLGSLSKGNRNRREEGEEATHEKQVIKFKIIKNSWATRIAFFVRVCLNDFGFICGRSCYPAGLEHSEHLSLSTVLSRFTVWTPKHWWNGSFLAK
jgi:hypothetical protein